jgi:pimeloyl-ACP methyl ester carboxylesterase
MKSKKIGRYTAMVGFAALAGACSNMNPAPEPVIGRDPIVFVHGNGNNAGLFIYTAWRFESNGWPSNRLFAYDLPDPASRDSDNVEQPGRSTAQQYAEFLDQRVAEVRQQTGSEKVILVGNSRGGYPIRYLMQTHGDEVRAAVLGGTPNHGTFISESILPASEYNGAGPWLKQLNAPKGPDNTEVPPGIPVLTLRSDHNDKYAQTTGAAYGHPELKTNITADAPALSGATNVVLPGVDHRETAYSASAFREMFRFLTGTSATVDVIPEAHPMVSGSIYAVSAKQPTNRGLPDTEIVVYQVDPATAQREGAAVWQQKTAADGHYGPMPLDSSARYEFVLRHAGYADTHIYMGALLRSTKWLDLILQPEDAEPVADSKVSLVRISGYLNTQRDHIDIDGTTPADITTPVPTVDTATVTIPQAQGIRSVTTRFNDEKIVVLSYPNRNDSGTSQRVIAELLD